MEKIPACKTVNRLTSQEIPNSLQNFRLLCCAA